MLSGEQGSHRCSHRNEMVIYSVALLAFSMLLGTYLGDLIGVLIGVQANVGGVGIAMLVLLILSNGIGKLSPHIR